MHKSNWVTVLKNHLIAIKGTGWVDENLTTINAAIVAIQAVTDELPDAGALSSLALEATLTAIKGDGWSDETLAAIKAALDDVALEATLTAIKGDGWSAETLVAIKAAIDAIGASQAYQEQIPDTDFALAAIDDTLTASPPSADAENKVVDIDQNTGDTFVLRSLWVNITSLGTAGTKLIFKLWVMLNMAVTKVDEVEISSLGIQNLMDIFGLPEVHADGIWVTVQTDSASGDAACSGTYRYAKATAV